MKLVMALIPAQNVGAPVWTPIMLPGEEVEYALYSQSGVIENFTLVASIDACLAGDSQSLPFRPLSPL